MVGIEEGSSDGTILGTLLGSVEGTNVGAFEGVFVEGAVVGTNVHSGAPNFVVPMVDKHGSKQLSRFPARFMLFKFLLLQIADGTLPDREFESNRRL